jgi:predicted phage terminase large subunit-like protein
VASEAALAAFAQQATMQHGDLTIRNALQVNPLGWKDPRTEPGELLCPSRFGPTEVARAKQNLGPIGFATQHQQRPVPAGGAMFSRTAVRVVRPTELPRGPFSECRGWDQAASKPKPGTDPDYTVGVRMRRYARNLAGEPTGIYVIMHVIRDRFTPEEGDAVLLSTAQADGRACKVREEQEGGSAGKKVTAAHERLLQAFDYEGWPKSVNKAVYAKPFASRWNAGEVLLLAGEWNQAFIDEVCVFPGGRHDDQVDAAATAYHELAAHPVSTLTAAQVLAIGSSPEEGRHAGERKIF